MPSAAGAACDASLADTIVCWPVAVLQLQLGVLYFWTALAKLDGDFLGGSILPRIVGGNTNAAVVMVAEKAADLIRGRPAPPPLAI